MFVLLHVFEVGRDGCILSQRETHRQLNTLQHTQSRIRLSGETNPVTVSGNLFVLTHYNLDFTETVTLVTKSVVL